MKVMQNIGRSDPGHMNRGGGDCMGRHDRGVTCGGFVGKSPVSGLKI